MPVSPLICWTWNFGAGLSDAESSKLLQLLAAVQAQGKLAAAAAACEVSYRSAWGLLKRYEQHFGQPLVIKGRGRGTGLSDFGERLLALDTAARASLESVHAPWGLRLKELLAPSETAEPECLHIAASHDLALADWIENGRRVKVDIRWRGSEEALTALARGECDAAGFHIPGKLGSAETSAWLGRWLDLRQYAFFPVMRRQYGILTAPGNPFGITSLADVAKLRLRMVNRQRGSGTRGMIDQLLAANGLQASALPGYAHEEFTHDAVAAAVASGKVDVGVAIQAAAARYDLGFVPLGSDLYCLALRSAIANGTAVAHLVRRFRGETFKARLAALTGYAPVGDARRFQPWESFASQIGLSEQERT
jgi:molybdate transport repressor ModE-like protein